MKTLTLPKSIAVAALALALAPLALTGCGASSQASQSGSAGSNSASSASVESTSAEVPASSEASSAAASSSSASSSSASAQPTSQSIGDTAKTGTIQVPGSWADTSSLLDSKMVSDYNVVQFADLDSRYTSKALKGDAYSTSVRMQQFADPREGVVKGLTEAYGSDSMYGDVTTEETEFNGHKATVVNTKLVEDNLTITDIAIDRNGDDKACVLITLQAMPEDVEAVLGYASSWSLDEQA